MIVDRSRVLKFFFKQAAFYESLYAPLVDILECSLSSCQGVPVLLQPRYAQAAIGNHQVALRSLPRIPEEVSQMLDKLPHLRQQLSLRQGLRRMFECYRGTVAPDGIAPYLDIIAEIETMLGHFETKLCHGDVTAANIVIGRDGVPRLIDFDKLMVAPRSYDQVYFTSSALERQGALWALHLVKAMKRISDSVRTMKAELSQPIGWLNEAEISLCTLIIGLFKRIERDLNYDSVGHSGSELREGVRFVLAQIR